MGAGPLEDPLTCHGEAIVDLVEGEVAANERLRLSPNKRVAA